MSMSQQAHFATLLRCHMRLLDMWHICHMRFFHRGVLYFFRSVQCLSSLSAVLNMNKRQLAHLLALFYVTVNATISMDGRVVMNYDWLG